MRDYEVLRRELPNDNEVAESLFHAQVALKKSHGEDVYNMKFGGEVELVSGLQQFRAAISSSGKFSCIYYLNLPSIIYYITQQLQLETVGASVVHFKAASNLQCKQISPFLDTLSTKFPSISFLKVNSHRPEFRTFTCTTEERRELILTYGCLLFSTEGGCGREPNNRYSREY